MSPVLCLLSLVSCLPVLHLMSPVSLSPPSCLMSSFSRFLSQAYCLMSTVSFLLSLVSCHMPPVLHILSHVFCLTSPVSLSHVSFLSVNCFPVSLSTVSVSSLTSPVSGLTSPVSRLQSPVSHLLRGKGLCGADCQWFSGFNGLVEWISGLWQFSGLNALKHIFLTDMKFSDFLYALAALFWIRVFHQLNFQLAMPYYVHWYPQSNVGSWLASLLL